MNVIVQSGKNKNLFSAMIRWQFMTVVQLPHPYWESIVVLKYHLASSLQAMRYWFNSKLILVSQKVDLDWNIHTRVRHKKLIPVIIINYLTLNYIMFHVSDWYMSNVQIKMELGGSIRFCYTKKTTAS